MGQDRRMTIGIARNHQSDTQAICERGKSTEQRPALQTGAGYIAINRHKMIEEPGMFNGGNAISFQPDLLHALIRRAHRSRLDTKAEFCHFNLSKHVYRGDDRASLRSAVPGGGWLAYHSSQ